MLLTNQREESLSGLIAVYLIFSQLSFRMTVLSLKVSSLLSSPNIAVYFEILWYLCRFKSSKNWFRLWTLENTREYYAGELKLITNLTHRLSTRDISRFEHYSLLNCAFFSEMFPCFFTIWKITGWFVWRSAKMWSSCLTTENWLKESY